MKYNFDAALAFLKRTMDDPGFNSAIKRSKNVRDLGNNLLIWSAPLFFAFGLSKLQGLLGKAPDAEPAK